MNSEVENSERVEKAKELANQAVEEKTRNIQEAIATMEQAITLHCIDKYVARLAYYYHLAGNKEKCLELNLKRLELLDSSDALSFHIDKANVLDDIRKFYFREGDFEEALRFQCQAEWHRQVGLACQGKLSEDMLRNWKPLEGANVKKAFKALNNEEQIGVFKDRFKQIFNSTIDVLSKLSTLSKSFDWADDRLRRETLSKSQEFQGAYNILLNNKFEEHYDKKLAPLIEHRNDQD
jgi:hypothetical protein